MIVLLLIGGLVFPQATVAISFLFVIARLIYTVCYLKWGSDSRKIASLSGNVPAMMLGLASVASLTITYVL